MPFQSLPDWDVNLLADCQACAYLVVAARVIHCGEGRSKCPCRQQGGLQGIACQRGVQTAGVHVLCCQADAVVCAPVHASVHEKFSGTLIMWHTGWRQLPTHLRLTAQS